MELSIFISGAHLWIVLSSVLIFKHKPSPARVAIVLKKYSWTQLKNSLIRFFRIMGGENGFTMLDFDCSYVYRINRDTWNLTKRIKIWSHLLMLTMNRMTEFGSIDSADNNINKIFITKYYCAYQIRHIYVTKYHYSFCILLLCQGGQM